MPTDRPVRRADSLNALGRAVALGGGAIRLAANAIDAAIQHAADVVVDAERAFKQGLDPNIEDAKVLGEWEADAEEGRSPHAR